jgi:hypothetical protein
MQYTVQRKKHDTLKSLCPWALGSWKLDSLIILSSSGGNVCVRSVCIRIANDWLQEVVQNKNPIPQVPVVSHPQQ